MKKLNLLTCFLSVYFYEIEQKLNGTRNELDLITFQSKTENTDKFLKHYFKNYLSIHNSIKETKIEKLELQIDTQNYQINTKELFNYQILNVFLPEELTSSQKQEITKSKNSIYINPDLYLEISDGKTLFYEPLDIKSIRNDTISDASLQKISPFEWVIFIKKNAHSVSVATGFYLTSFIKKVYSADYIFYPQVSYKNLVKSNRIYRIQNNATLFVENKRKTEVDKIELLVNWQEYLATQWLKIIQIQLTKKNTEQINWINTLKTIPKKFLEYIDNLSEEEKIKIQQKIQKIIN